MDKNKTIIDGIFNRRSIRKFKNTPIPKQDIDLMLHALEAAPSAGNLQPWFFYVVKNEKLKNELCKLSFDQESVKLAPIVFVVCSIPKQSAEKYGEIGEQFFSIQDTAAATQNLLLTVHHLNYGAVWIGVIKDKEIAETLNLPKEHKPVAIIPVGVPDETPEPYDRKGWQTVSKTID